MRMPLADSATHTCLALRGICTGFQSTAYHELDHLVVIDGVACKCARQHSISKDDNSIGDALDLVKSVRNKDNADTFCL